MFLSLVSLALAQPCTSPAAPFYVAPDGTAWRWASGARHWCLEAVDELGDVHAAGRWPRQESDSRPPAVAPLPDGRMLVARPVPGGQWRLARRSACGDEEALPATLPAAPSRLEARQGGTRAQVTLTWHHGERSWTVDLSDGHVTAPAEGPYDATVTEAWP